ncbi:hypothetical protein E3T43_07340 [Cryobacterium sp. Hh7]|uniref:hypothetical protein n=1 Tax=Cryobacterium sp. Hh7 TaxID=1259159 RepID=UPI00106CA309|nr:hypothetical protein [Cryobacterium sp. Hh7]TFD58052.1 hypothetical protein E3T43_07340 [Cryobacterium sp. Hh7]
MTNREAVIEDLQYIGAYDYNKDRGERIETARRENITWREIAQHLGMTETGVHKAYAAYIAKRDAK